nr:hypothetical protein [Pyrobaculum aerophilum]
MREIKVGPNVVKFAGEGRPQSQQKRDRKQYDY